MNEDLCSEYKLARSYVEQKIKNELDIYYCQMFDPARDRAAQAEKNLARLIGSLQTRWARDGYPEKPIEDE